MLAHSRDNAAAHAGAGTPFAPAAEAVATVDTERLQDNEGTAARLAANEQGWQSRTKKPWDMSPDRQAIPPQRAAPPWVARDQQTAAQADVTNAAILNSPHQISLKLERAEVQREMRRSPQHTAVPPSELAKAQQPATAGVPDASAVLDTAGAPTSPPVNWLTAKEIAQQLRQHRNRKAGQPADQDDSAAVELASETSVAETPAQTQFHGIPAAAAVSPNSGGRAGGAGLATGMKQLKQLLEKAEQVADEAAGERPPEVGACTPRQAALQSQTEQEDWGSTGQAGTEQGATAGATRQRSLSPERPHFAPGMVDGHRQPDTRVSTTSQSIPPYSPSRGETSESDYDSADEQLVKSSPIGSRSIRGAMTSIELAFEDVAGADSLEEEGERQEEADNPHHEERERLEEAETEIERTSSWVEYVDDATGLSYFHNPDTGEVSWEAPHDRSLKI